MAEMLTVSVLLNLYLIWRFALLYRQHRMAMNLLYKVSTGEMSINFDEDGVEIKVKKS